MALPGIHGAARRAVEAHRRTLLALGEVVLPASELGPQGVERAVLDFESWMAGYEPEAERDHPYLWSDEIRHAPSDPRPRWRSQLEALESAARGAGATSLGDLDPSRRRRVLQAALSEEVGPDLPRPEEAPHVGIALAARFFRRAEANDLCYRRAIGRHTCRGLPSVVEEPPSLPSTDPASSRRGVR